jgi:hypothetical protein
VLLGDVDEEVRIGFLVGLLEVAVRLDGCEAGLADQLPRVVLAKREHVESELGAVRERVQEAGEALVDVLRFCADVVSAVVVLVLRREAVIQDRVVIALVEDEDAVVLQCGIELGEGAPAVLLVE